MYRPWEAGRSSSVHTTNAYPVYPEYTLNRRLERRGGDGRGRSPLAMLRLGKNCAQMEDGYCDEYEYDQSPPPFTLFNGYIHVKSLSMAKLALLVLWLTRECQLQMMDQICRSGSTLHTCSRSPCAWLHMLMGGMPWALQIDALCNALLLGTMISALLFLGALWLRERQASSLHPSPSTLLKIVLIAFETLLELCFTFGLAYQLVTNMNRRQGGELVWSSVKGLIVMSIALASFLLHITTSLYICDRGQSFDYSKESSRLREDRRRRVDDYEDSMDVMNAGRRDDCEQAFGRAVKTGVHGMPLLGAVPLNHMTQLPPGSTGVYHTHSGTASPAYYNEPCQSKTSSSEESGVSSVGYGRLRQALRQQAKASRAAAVAAASAGQHHHLLQKSMGGASPHLHLAPSSSRPDLAAMSSSASAAALAASSVAGVAPPPVLLSPQAAAAAAPFMIEEAAGDYSQVRSLRQAELMRQSGVARSRKNSPASIHRRSQEGLLHSSSTPRLHVDTRPESAYLEVI
ncbi:hypothetical protein PMAYCL1PPCAC_24278 [Pristionchus mayeri]|uniref:Uncharacterized protein n=1 Tax=Pristionchus mayeri TaxID=1317129 RepID=A0AAN5D064_9BILA|nr:hypothetical protein PMAYCL1PPCAC_24278 [Pristionchus mayeri]